MFAYDFCFVALREHKRPEGNVTLMKYTQALFFCDGLFRLIYPWTDLQ
jgi:hypothetical protein